eukprot:g7289.t1
MASAAAASSCSSTTQLITIATLNCYLIPKLLVNQANKTCERQDARALAIGEWLGKRKITVAGLQEVWGSHCFEMERGAAAGTIAAGSSPRSSRPKPNYSFLHKSLGSTVLDTLNVYAWKRTGGLQLVHDESEMRLLATGKQTYANSISKSGKGITCGLWEVLGPAEESNNAHKYVLLINTHLDHVNVADSQRKQIAELSDFIQRVAVELFGEPMISGGSGQSSTASPATATSSSSSASSRATIMQPRHDAAATTAPSRTPLDPGRTAVFVVGDFNIDGGTESEPAADRRARLTDECRRVAQKIRGHLGDQGASKSTFFDRLKDRILYPNPESGPWAMAEYFEKVDFVAEQEALYTELKTALEGGCCGSSASTCSASSSSRTASEGSSRRLLSVRDLQKLATGGGQHTYSRETNGLAEYQSRRLDYIFAVDAIAIRGSSSRSYELLRCEVDKVEMATQERGKEFSDHWGLVAEVRI